MFSRNSPLNIDIHLKDREGKPETIELDHNETVRNPIYLLEDTAVSGTVEISLVNNSKPVKYEKIHIELKAHLQDRQSELCFCYMKKAQQLDNDGIIEGPKEYEFSFRDFERTAETLKGHFGEIRVYLKVIVKPKSGDPITNEKDIALYLNQNRQQIRMHVVNITYKEKHVMRVNVDKRLYFPNQHIIGRLEINTDNSKPKKLTLELIKEEFFNIRPDSKVCSTVVQTIDRFDLTENLPKEDDMSFVPFKINLDKYNLVPSLNFTMGKVKYIIAYAIRVTVVEQQYNANWSSKMRIPIHRERDVI